MTLEQNVELLRRQLTALTKEVRRSQLHHHRRDGEQSEDADADSNSYFNNPFGQTVRGNQQVPVQEPRPGPMHLQVPQREEPKWETEIKVDLPKFQGSLNPEEFLD